MANTHSKAKVTKRAYSINEFGEAFGPGHTLTYQEIRAGRLKAKKVGRKTVILHDDAEDWAKNLEDWQPNQALPDGEQPSPDAQTETRQGVSAPPRSTRQALTAPRVTRSPPPCSKRARSRHPTAIRRPTLSSPG